MGGIGQAIAQGRREEALAFVLGDAASSEKPADDLGEAETLRQGETGARIAAPGPPGAARERMFDPQNVLHRNAAVRRSAA